MSADHGLLGFPQLPLLRFVEDELRVGGAQPLADFSVICVQHLLASTGSLLASLVRSGVDPDDMHVVGKAYSTNDGVFDTLRDCGVDVVNPAFVRTADEPYDAVLRRAVAQCVDRVARGSVGRKVLLIDDGGHALTESSRLLPRSKQLCAVEQTTRGIRVASRLPQRFCIVNVGRSQAKIELEAPLIASSMVHSLDHLLASAGDLCDAVERVVLIGYGAVGRHVASLLAKRPRPLVVFDAHPEVRALATDEGFAIIDELAGSLGRCLVIASTGVVSFPYGLHRLLESGSILANMGSSDLEFGAWQLRDSEWVTAVFDQSGRMLGQREPVSAWESHYLLMRDGRRTLLLKGGFPVDFDGSPDPIPAESIQLTRALLLAGALQASTEDRVGLVELDPGLHDRVVDKYLQLRRSLQGDLQT